MSNDILTQAIHARDSQSVVYFFPHEINDLVQQGLVESNPNVQETDANGNLTGRVAVRATPSAALPITPQEQTQPDQQTFVQQQPAPVQAPVEQPQAPAPSEAQPASSENGFAIIEKFTPPTKRTREVRYKYPFDKLENGNAFFVPATEENPNPKKKIAAAVGNANKKYRDYVPPRYFKSYRVEKGQALGNMTAQQNGCYVMRVDEDATTKE